MDIVILNLFYFVLAGLIVLVMFLNYDLALILSVVLMVVYIIAFFLIRNKE